MTKEQELLLALLRGELTGTAAELDEKTLSGADWDAVLKESQAQAVTLMAADALSSFGKYVTNIGAWTSCAARPPVFWAWSRRPRRRMPAKWSMTSATRPSRPSVTMPGSVWPPPMKQRKPDRN